MAGLGAVVFVHSPGPTMAVNDGSFTATEAGIWVTHEDVNPVTGEIEDKHFWLVAHDGLVFGSGWHHDESGS